MFLSSELFNLRKELSHLTQGTMSIAAYFTKFRTIQDELECLSAKPRCTCTTCTCTTCTCTINSKLEACDQTVQLTQFLMGLNEHFTGVRGQILIMNSLPSLSQCYSILLQEENQRESTGTVSLNKDNIAMSIRQNNSGKSYKTKTSQKSVDTSAVVCEYCHMTGHIKEKCFCLHGYPPWHRLHGKPKPRPKSHNSTVAAHVSETVTNMAPSASSEAASSNYGSLTLTDGQCKQLIQMLQQSMLSTSAESSSSNVVFNSSQFAAEFVAGSAWLGNGIPCVYSDSRLWFDLTLVKEQSLPNIAAMKQTCMLALEDTRAPNDGTKFALAASKSIAYSTSNGLVGVYNTHTRVSRDRNVVGPFGDTVEEAGLTHVAAVEFSPNRRFIFAVTGMYLLVLHFRNLQLLEHHTLEDDFDASVDSMLVSPEHNTLCISYSAGLIFWLVTSDGQLIDLFNIPNDVNVWRTCIDYDPNSRVFVSGCYDANEGQIAGIHDLAGIHVDGLAQIETWDFWGLLGEDTDFPIHVHIADADHDVVTHIAIHGRSICAAIASGTLIMSTYQLSSGFAHTIRIPPMEGGHELLGCCFPYRNIWHHDIHRHCPVILVYTDIIVLREAYHVIHTATVPEHHQLTSYTPDRFGPHLYLGTAAGHIITSTYGQTTFQWRSLTQVTANRIESMTA